MLKKLNAKKFRVKKFRIKKSKNLVLKSAKKC